MLTYMKISSILLNLDVFFLDNKKRSKEIIWDLLPWYCCIVIGSPLPTFESLYGEQRCHQYQHHRPHRYLKYKLRDINAFWYKLERPTNMVTRVSSVHNAAEHLESLGSEVLVKHQEQQWVHKGVNKANVKRHLRMENISTNSPGNKIFPHLVCHRVLCLLPIAGVINQRYLENMTPPVVY